MLSELQWWWIRKYEKSNSVISIDLFKNIYWITIYWSIYLLYLFPHIQIVLGNVGDIIAIAIFIQGKMGALWAGWQCLCCCKSFPVNPERVLGCWGPGTDCKSLSFIAPWTYAAKVEVLHPFLWTGLRSARFPPLGKIITIFLGFRCPVGFRSSKSSFESILHDYNKNINGTSHQWRKNILTLWFGKRPLTKSYCMRTLFHAEYSNVLSSQTRLLLFYGYYYWWHI